jgi:membrane protein CcdC involved in cytochrome C biogenesis
MQAGASFSPWISYAITGAIIAIVFAIRWRRMSRVRPLKLERLWVFPALYAAVAAYMFVQHPPQGLAWLFCFGALVAGAALGWQRGKTMRITVDPETHTLNQSASPAAVLFIVALVAVRSAARMALTGDNVLHLNAWAVTDMLIALALGLFTAQRLEMYLRAKRLLDAASISR